MEFAHFLAPAANQGFMLPPIFYEPFLIFYAW